MPTVATNVQTKYVVRELLLVAFFAIGSLFLQGCGTTAKALTASDFEFSESLAVYDECGILMPHPDCPAYRKLGVKPSGNIVADIVELGKRYLGKPYRYRGGAPWAFDCSGYIRFLYGSFGIKLRGSSADISKVTTPVKDPQPGDLLFFKGRNSKSSRVGHVAMLIEVKPNGSYVMMHSTNQRGIVVEQLDRSAYFKRRYIGARRVPKMFKYMEETNDAVLSESLPPTFTLASISPTILRCNNPSTSLPEVKIPYRK